MMNIVVKLLFALLLAAVLAGCAPAGAGALLYCLAVDHDINRKCQ